MNFRELAAAFNVLAAGGVNPVALVPISALCSEVSARISAITVDSPAADIMGALDLAEQLEEKLHALAAQHRAASEISTVASD